MRVVCLPLSFAISALFLIPSGAQQTATQQSNPSVQRDAQAISILSQAVNAVGGHATVAGIQDFTATGTITYSWAGEAVPGTVTVYGKGVHQFRMDANVSGGTQSLTVNFG